MAKAEITNYEYFLLIPHYFLELSAADACNSVCKWERDNSVLFWICGSAIQQASDYTDPLKIVPG